MKSQKAALINSIVLIFVGIWGYVANHFAMHTLIVPLSCGILLMILSRFLQIENRNILLLIISFTFILIIAFIVPFQRNIEQADLWGMFRIGIEMIVSAMALIIYLRNFGQIKMNNQSNA